MKYTHSNRIKIVIGTGERAFQDNEYFIVSSSLCATHYANLVDMFLWVNLVHNAMIIK